MRISPWSANADDGADGGGCVLLSVVEWLWVVKGVSLAFVSVSIKREDVPLVIVWCWTIGRARRVEKSQNRRQPTH